MLIIIMLSIMIIFELICAKANEVGNEIVSNLATVFQLIVFIVTIVVSIGATINPITNNDGTINKYIVQDYNLDSNNYCISYINNETEINICSTNEVIFDESINKPVVVIKSSGTIPTTYKIFFPWVALMEDHITEITLYIPKEEIK